MKVDVNCKSVLSIDINDMEAFRILVKTLYMDCVLDDLNTYIAKENKDTGELCVYQIVNGEEVLYDDRGELYEALIRLSKTI